MAPITLLVADISFFFSLPFHDNLCSCTGTVCDLVYYVELVSFTCMCEWYTAKLPHVVVTKLLVSQLLAVREEQHGGFQFQYLQPLCTANIHLQLCGNNLTLCIAPI